MFKEKLLKIKREKELAIKAMQELLNDEKFKGAAKKVENLREAIIKNVSEMSASDVEKYAMDIYAAMAEIKLLNAILKNCAVLSKSEVE